MKYLSDFPIYLQIMQEMKTRIARGALQQGERLPSVREAALEFSVNPNTMQRAFTELEREGLVYSERTSGRFITADQRIIEKVRTEMAEEYLKTFFLSMRSIGYEKADMLHMLDTKLG